jgi:hypothetical protein
MALPLLVPLRARAIRVGVSLRQLARQFGVGGETERCLLSGGGLRAQRSWRDPCIFDHGTTNGTTHVMIKMLTSGSRCP